MAMGVREQDLLGIGWVMEWHSCVISGGFRWNDKIYVEYPASYTC